MGQCCSQREKCAEEYRASNDNPQDGAIAVVCVGEEPTEANHEEHCQSTSSMEIRHITTGSTEGGDSRSLMGPSFRRQGTGSTVLQVGNRARTSGMKLLQRHLSTLAAGHGGTSILKDYSHHQDQGDIPDFIIKVYDKAEADVYRELQRVQDPLTRFTASFHGEVCSDEVPDVKCEDGQKYIRLSNLLKHFKRGANVMDCKVGIRSFAEDEASRAKLRPDLYQRLVKLDSHAVTEEERKAGACTKFRWMQFNDGFTCLKELGFRIDGIATSGATVDKGVLRNALTVRDNAQVIVDHFLPELEDDGIGEMDKLQELAIQLDCVDKILLRLKELKHIMQVSEFVRMHSFVGSSLLFITDGQGPGADVFLIDFAKIQPVPQTKSIDHVSEWKMGNYEDGLFIGMDNMFQCWEEVRQLLDQKRQRMESG